MISGKISFKFNHLQNIWRRGWDSNPNVALIRRKLLILLDARDDKNDKNDIKTHVIHTRISASIPLPTRVSSGSEPSAENLDSPMQS
jgi:hypothetical protein